MNLLGPQGPSSPETQGLLTSITLFAVHDCKVKKVNKTNIYFNTLNLIYVNKYIIKNKK